MAPAVMMSSSQEERAALLGRSQTSSHTRMPAKTAKGTQRNAWHQVTEIGAVLLGRVPRLHQHQGAGRSWPSPNACN